MPGRIDGASGSPGSRLRAGIHGPVPPHRKGARMACTMPGTGGCRKSRSGRVESRTTTGSLTSDTP